MKTEDARSSNWEDLVFEHRNKDYGAFPLRRSYPGSLSEAALFSMILVSLALVGPRLLSLLRGEKSVPPVIIYDPGRFPLPIPRIIPVVDPPKAVHTQPQKRVRDVAPLVVIVPVVETPVDPPIDLPSPDTNPVGGDSGPLISSGVETPVVSPTPAIMDNPEVMPRYEGGMKAMMKFIQKNMKYPNSARRIGTEGKVFLKFVVNQEGRVVNIEILRGISEDCDKEAARVIALLPDWKPGMQNRMPVSVRMVLPINFTLEH